MRAGIGPIFLIVALFGCHSKTKATADLLASLDTELSRTEVEVQKCLRVQDERSEVLARKLSLLRDTHQRTMSRNYANVVPLVRAEGDARKGFDAFYNQRRRCQELESHGIVVEGAARRNHHRERGVGPASMVGTVGMVREGSCRSEVPCQ